MKLSMSKVKTIFLAASSLFLLAACGSSSSSGLGEIQVISREDGSGTRGAFTEIVGLIEEKDGNTVDLTAKSAVIQNNTEGVLSSVKGDINGIGYISLGSLNETVKAIKIDGVEANVEDVVNGSYPLQRPFNIAWKKDSLSELAQDFVDFIFSKEGQAIVTDHKYIAVETDAPSYSSKGLTGKLAVVGSTSVSPLMEKLAEAYQAANAGVTIDITSNGSSAGMTAAMEGTADIGMASRELKEKELASLDAKAIAIDGIAVIVNTENTVEDLTLDQVKAVFKGDQTSWTDLISK